MLPEKKHALIEEARSYTGRKFHGVRTARRAIATALRKGRKPLKNGGYRANAPKAKTPAERAKGAAKEPAGK